MRSYGQYCSVAKALDVVGDRWTLLIVRELLSREASRYTDLRSGLPGIATNLLADRLRDLEATGVVDREDAPPPVATTVYRLTERGRALQPVITELAHWGLPLMHPAPPGDEFRGHWLQFPARTFLVDNTPREAPCSVEIRAGGEVVVVDICNGAATLRLGGDPTAKAVITGSPDHVLALMSGALSVRKALRQGVKIGGSVAAVERMLPTGRGTGPAGSPARPSETSSGSWKSARSAGSVVVAG